MSDRMTGTKAEWLAVWKREATARGWSDAEIEHRAGLTDKHLSRLRCGDIGEPTAATIAKVNRAFGLEVKISAFDSVDGV